jgi:hypothetical protein
MASSSKSHAAIARGHHQSHTTVKIVRRNFERSHTSSLPRQLRDGAYQLGHGRRRGMMRSLLGDRFVCCKVGFSRPGTTREGR